jgi:hypothetical protein
MDQMNPPLEVKEEYQLVYAQMRHTNYYFTSVKQLSQESNLNMS